MAAPVVTPRTWVVGEVVTAAMMNAEVRAQFTGLAGLFCCTQVTTGSFAIPSHASNYTAVQFSAIASSNDTSMWTGGNPTRLIAPRAGTYLMHGGISWPSGLSTNDARSEFRYNGSGTTVSTARMGTQTESSGNCQSTASGVVVFTTAGHYVELYCNQNSGGSLNVSATMGMTCISQATS